MSAAILFTFCLAAAGHIIQPQPRDEAGLLKTVTVTAKSLSTRTTTLSAPLQTPTCGSSCSSCTSSCGCEDDQDSEDSTDIHDPRLQPWLWGGKKAPNHKCGFSINDQESDAFALFTDYVESDFLHTKKLEDEPWMPVIQSAHDPDTVEPNPLQHDNEWYGVGKNWGKTSMKLLALANRSAEQQQPWEAFYRTDRDDILYGSFRTVLTIPKEPGIMVGFNWLSERDETEDDKDFHMAGIIVAPVNKTHILTGTGFISGEPALAAKAVAGIPISGNTAALGGHLDIRLHENKGRSHEWRFDWLPRRLDCYCDGYLMMSHLYPNELTKRPGYVAITVWPNSAFPVVQENQVITATYAKLYFNTTDHESKTATRWRDRKCSA